MSGLEHVGVGLDGLLRRLGMPELVDLERLVDGWEELAGEPWASAAVPVGWHEGTLDVEVTDGSTATLLRYETDGLIRRLSERLGCQLVASVRIRVANRKKAL
jgi:predicted nucleic acid-binding Zn ribbon protein